MKLNSARFLGVAVYLLLALTCATSTFGQVIHVDANAVGFETGISWFDAYSRLQDALAAASSGDTIWVANGTYYPDESNGGSSNTNDRSSTFQLISGVVLYGGFAGGETSHTSRNPEANPTILSGDLLKNDGANFANNGENAYHVVTGSGADGTAVIDGFRITAGNANGTDPDDLGGGIYLDGGNPTITRNYIFGNSAVDGGGIYSIPFFPQEITENVITGNRATGNGGGMLIAANDAVVSRNTFSNNEAATGGGLWSNGFQFITANTITGNTANVGAGIIANNSPSIKGNTIVGNIANFNGGGGIRTSNSPSIESNIVYGNSNVDGSGASAQLDITSGGTPTVSYSIVQGGLPVGAIDGGNNLTSDPLLGPLGDNGGPTETMLPSRLSPAIDAGTCGGQVIDQRRETRPFDVGYASDVDDQCDIGSVEIQASDLLLPSCDSLCFVDASATGTQSGDSWTDAYTTLQDALVGADSADTIWVAAGVYYPDVSIGGLVDTDDRSATFILESGVSIFGGFAGDEVSLEERDPVVNPTILSGDLSQDDGSDFANNGENAYHVVTGSGVDSTALIDGFIITAGNADSVSAPGNRGGGFYIDAGSPTISGNTIDGNSATNGGGLYHLNGSGPQIEMNTFSNNRATTNGGAVFSNGGTAVLAANTIVANMSGGDGAGIYNFGNSSSIISNTITDNEAQSDGGAVYNLQASPSLVGNTIVDNMAAALGGGLSNWDGSNATVVSVILYGNTDATAASPSGQIFNNSSAPNVSYSIVEGGFSAGTADGGNNLTDDPLLGPLQDNGGPAATMLPSNGSPAIDTGTCAGQTVDQRGELRPFDADDGTFPNTDDGCDIGAVELVLVACPVPMAVRIFLEGPYSTTTDHMAQTLLTNGDVPLNQPFDAADFDATHLEFDETITIDALPDSVVDWVMVGLRSQADGGDLLSAPALVSANGYLFTPGLDSLCLDLETPGSYYLTVGARNHLQVMSAAQLDLTGSSAAYDFTTAATQAYPGDDASAQQMLESGVFGLFSADATIDGQITAGDFNAWLTDTKAAATGYMITDFNLDGQVTASDFNLWLANTKLAATSKVPDIVP